MKHISNSRGNLCGKSVWHIFLSVMLFGSSEEFFNNRQMVTQTHTHTPFQFEMKWACIRARDARQTNKKVSNGDELTACHMKYKAEVIIITDVDRLTTQWVNEILDGWRKKHQPFRAHWESERAKDTHTYERRRKKHNKRQWHKSFISIILHSYVYIFCWCCVWHRLFCVLNKNANPTVISL